MSIVPFPTDRTRDLDPTPPSASSRRPRAARAIDLQTSRESAGFTLEGLARRMITVLRLKSHDGNLTAKDEGDFLPHLAAKLAFMEQVSQATYDRTVSWFSTPVHERRGGRPRIYLPYYDDAFAAIALGMPSASLDELREALSAASRAAKDLRNAQTARALERRGRSIAAMVWNFASDPDFLDQALCVELRGSGERDDPSLTGWDSFLVRTILTGLAHELRVTFPARPSIDIDWMEAA